MWFSSRGEEGELPALFVQGGAVDDHKGILIVGAVQVQRLGNLLLAGARLAQDQHRLSRGRQRREPLFQRADGTADAQKAVLEQVLHLVVLIQVNARVDGLAGEDGLGIAEHIERLIGKGHGLRGDPQVGQLIGVQELPHCPGTKIADALDEIIPDLFRDGVLGGIAQFLLAVEHQNVPPGLPHGVLQKRDLPAHPAVFFGEIHRVLKGGVQAFCAAGDEKGAVSQLPGDAVGDIVADDHAVAAQLQPLQRRAHLGLTVNGDDVRVEAQQVTQCMGRPRDAGKAHDGIQTVVVLGHFDGAQDVINRKGDLDHRQGRFFLQQFCGAAAGEYNVVILFGKALRDLDALLQVAGVRFKAHRGKLFPRHALHGGTDALKGRDP